MKKKTFKKRMTAFTTALATVLTVSSSSMRPNQNEAYAAVSSNISIGDINNDGIVDSFDLVSLRKSIANNISWALMVNLS